MKKIFLILTSVFIVTSTSGQESIKNTINKAIDYGKSGLSENAKELLIEALYQDKDSLYHPRIRYILGSICFEMEDIDCAQYHWSIVTKNFPNSNEALAIFDLMQTYDFLQSTWAENLYENLTFSQELDISRKFWTLELPDWKMNWSDIKDWNNAIQYLNVLINKYKDDPDKKSILLFDKFLLFAGYNKEGLGYKHTHIAKSYYKSDKEKKEGEVYFLDSCEVISYELRNLTNNTYYLRSQFLLGVMTSGTKFLSSEIVLNDYSVKYFKEVASITKNDLSNPYNIFASIWLDEYYLNNK